MEGKEVKEEKELVYSYIYIYIKKKLSIPFLKRKSSHNFVSVSGLLDIIGLGSVVTLGKLVKLIFVLVGLDVGEVEANGTDESEDSSDAVVPFQEGVFSKRDEGLSNGGGDGIHEECDTLDEGSHVLWGLGEGIFKTGDGSENFGDTTKNIRHSLNPDGNGRTNVVLLATEVGILAARVGFVEVVLEDSGRNHTATGEDEAGGDTFDWGKVEAKLSACWVQNIVHDRDEEDKCEGVKVVDNVVWNTSKV